MIEDKKTYQLETILEEREKVLHELRTKEIRIKKFFSDISTPIQAPKSNSTSFMGNIDRYFAIYDGVMIGYKIFKRLKKSWRYNRKY